MRITVSTSFVAGEGFVGRHSIVLAAPFHTATEKAHEYDERQEIANWPQPEEIIADPEGAVKLAL